MSAHQVPPELGPADDAPIFIVGSMRSGSTMLRLILDSHPRIAVGAETGFVGGLVAAREIPQWTNGKGWYRRIGWTDDDFDARLRGFYSGLFARYAAEQGKQRWGEKTPYHTGHMDVMAEVFPGAVFVGIVRHPGAVAASLRKKFHYTFDEALAYWRATNLTMVRSAQGLQDRFALCRYEDVVQHAEPVLRELTAFLGEEWSNDVLAHHQVQRAKGTPRAADGTTSTREAIDPARAAEWLSQVGPAERPALEACRPLAEFFGYDPTAGGESGSAWDTGTWLARGSDLKTRIAEWAGSVDFDERPAVPVLDANPDELARRLAHVEAALARTRSRRAIRWVDAARKVQYGRSRMALRDAWKMFRSGQ